MISVLEENRSPSPLPGECRFYDSDFHQSEVKPAPTQCWRTELRLLLSVVLELARDSFKRIMSGNEWLT